MQRALVDSYNVQLDQLKRDGHSHETQRALADAKDIQVERLANKWSSTAVKQALTDKYERQLDYLARSKRLDREVQREREDEKARHSERAARHQTRGNGDKAARVREPSEVIVESRREPSYCGSESDYGEW